MNDGGRVGRTKGTPFFPTPRDQVQSLGGGLRGNTWEQWRYKAARPGTSAWSSEWGVWVQALVGQQGEHSASLELGRWTLESSSPTPSRLCNPEQLFKVPEPQSIHP